MSPKNKKDDVQDPAEPKKVENDVQTEGNAAAEVDENTDSPPVENRAADVGAQGNYPRWSGNHPDNDAE